MARYFGRVGYGHTVEVRQDVYDEVVTEHKYYGDVVRNTRVLESGDAINNDISVGNNIEIVADAYALEHFFAIRYVEWAGTFWTVTEVEVRRPRLLLRLGGVYRGPKAPAE